MLMVRTQGVNDNFILFIVEYFKDGSDEIPGTPQETKKAKKSNKKPAVKSKHTRIMKIEDSSEDEGISIEFFFN